MENEQVEDGKKKHRKYAHKEGVSRNVKHVALLASDFTSTPDILIRNLENVKILLSHRG